MIDVLTTNFDAYVHSPLRALITTVGTSAVALNIADTWQSALPGWMQSVVDGIMSFPYMSALSYIAVLMLVLERYYSLRIKRLEVRKLQQQIKRGDL